MNKQPNFKCKATRKRRAKTNKQTSVGRRKEIIKIRAKVDEKEMKMTITMIDKTKSWFLKKINKIDKPFYRQTRFIKKKREKTQINKIRNENEKIT